MDNNKEKNPGRQLSFEFKPDTPKAYSNLAIISHSHSEFVVDFASLLPGSAKAEIVSRVIMVPEHAKRLFMALQDNIIKYESQYGTIEIDSRLSKGGGNTLNLNDFGPFGGGTKS